MASGPSPGKMRGASLMTESHRLLATDFKDEPYWWEAFRPQALPAPSLPTRSDVVVVGGGYAGLSAARALADGGVQSVVLEAGDFGAGASTRSGGAISAGLSIGKSFTGRTLAYAPELVREVVGWSIEAYRSLARLIETEKIECHLEQRGRFLGACAPSHYEGLRQRFEKLRAGGATDCRLVSREEQREEIGSDYYHGGMVLETAGKLHPALFYGGLLAAVRRRNSVTLAGNCRATGLNECRIGHLVQGVRRVVARNLLRVSIATRRVRRKIHLRHLDLRQRVLRLVEVEEQR